MEFELEKFSFGTHFFLKKILLVTMIPLNRF